MSSDSGENLKIRPLTKRKRTGELYERRPEVEAQLPEAVRLLLEDLSERLSIPNKEDPGYLYDETLVYLLREAHRREATLMENLIYDHLAVRVEMLLHKLSTRLYPEQFKDLCQDVHGKLVEKIYDLESDKADFAQVMFGSYIVTLGRSEARKYWVINDSDKGNIEIDAPNEDGYDYDPEANDLSPDTIAIIRNALDRVDQNTATAFVMHYIEGFQIESKDPDEPTVAKHFGVTGRTIRNWFRDAVRTLAATNGGER